MENILFWKKLKPLAKIMFGEHLGVSMIEVTYFSHFTAKQSQLCVELAANLSDGKGTCVSHPEILILSVFT